MRKLLLLVILTSCATLPPEPHGLAGLLIPEHQLPQWAAPPTNFKLNTDTVHIGDTLKITVGPADYSWGETYVLTDYNIWDKIVINPLLSQGKIINQWVKGTARFTLDITDTKFTPGNTYYLIAYWCNKRAAWQCNNNKWMLISFNVESTLEDKQSPPETEPAMEEIDELEQILNEIEQLEKEFEFEDYANVEDII